MLSARSFSEDEGSKVKDFIVEFLAKNPMSTRTDLENAVRKEFPKVDEISAVYHLLPELISVGQVGCETQTVFWVVSRVVGS